MAFVPYNGAYEKWMPIVARVLLAIQFGIAAFFKIVGFSGEVAQTAQAGVPLATVAVSLALVLEVMGVVSLLTGWQIRRVSAVLAPYVLLLAVIFYHNWSNIMTFGTFVSHLGLIAALLYVSVYGAQHMTVVEEEILVVTRE